MTKTDMASAATAVLMTFALGACQAPTTPSSAPAADTGKVADAVKADVAQLVLDFNAHDAAKTVSHDAPDVVQMAHGTANVVGPAADLAANKALFADTTQHFAVANESVDVAASGEMAVYRSTYVYNFVDPKTKKPTTENGNYLAGYKKQADGSWKIEWASLSDTGAPAAAAAPS